MLFLVGAALAQDADRVVPDCPNPTPLTALQDAYTRGETSFANLDLDGLNQAATDAETGLPCLREPITPKDAAAYHRLMGMHAFASQERDRVKTEFHAARKLQPGYEVPAEVAPVGHPMIAAYDEAVLVDEGELQQPIPPVDGFVTVGGVRGAARAANSPAVIQVYETGDVITETLYLPPGAEMPLWGPAPTTGRDLRKPMLIATAATGAVAIGMYGAAYGMKSNFLDTEDPIEDDRLDDVYVRNRVTFFGSLGVGAAAIGLGTVTVLVW